MMTFKTQDIHFRASGFTFYGYECDGSGNATGSGACTGSGTGCGTGGGILQACRVHRTSPQNRLVEFVNSGS